MDNSQIGKLILETGRLLELRDGASGDSRAYQRLGGEITGLPRQLVWMPREKWPEAIADNPEVVVDSLCILLEQGSLPMLLDLRSSLPPGLVEMLELPGFSPVRIRILREKLDIESVEDLEGACHGEKVRELSEFDERSEAEMLDAITFWRSNKDRHQIHIAWSRPIRCWSGCAICRGDSVRCHRRSASLDGNGARHFLPRVGRGHGCRARTLCRSRRGRRGDGTAGHFRDRRAQGRPAFHPARRERPHVSVCAHEVPATDRTSRRSASARERGFELNEYGMTRTELDAGDPKARVRCHGEEDIYNLLDLQFIPPEMRENEGEFDAAAKNQIPPLVEWTALRGSLHNHSNWSDGRQSLKEMASDAYDLGCSYWAVTDHSRSCFAGKGLDEKRLIAQINEVELVNQLYQDADRPFRLLSGTEMDVKSGGKMDFDDEILAQLDVVVASIHQALSGSEAEMTRRLVAAAESRYVHMIGHMTGRLLLQRDGYKVNQKAVIDACAETGTWIELNASPWRFDMDWRLWRYAREKGVKCAVNTNSHRAEHGQYLRFGAHVARKGWLTKYDIVNTLPLKQLRDTLLTNRLDKAGRAAGEKGS